MANAIARPREKDPVLGRYALQIAMIVRVAKVGLQHVVVDVAHREFRAHAGQIHGLELQIGHGSRGVLRQSLVDAQADLLARHHRVRGEVRSDDLLREVAAHECSFCRLRWESKAPRRCARGRAAGSWQRNYTKGAPGSAGPPAAQPHIDPADGGPPSTPLSPWRGQSMPYWLPASMRESEGKRKRERERGHPTIAGGRSGCPAGASRRRRGPARPDARTGRRGAKP